MSDNAAGFRAALAGVADRPNVVAGSDAERTGIAGVKGLLGKIDAANVRASTSKVYAPDCYLNDTLKTLHGSAAIEAYFLATAETAESVAATFTIHSPMAIGLRHRPEPGFPAAIKRHRRSALAAIR